MTRSQPPPPNPCSPDPLPNPPQPLKTPRTTPLPQSPGASIAHLRNHDRTPPFVRPHPLAVTPITTRRPTPISHTRTLTLPEHTISPIDNPPTTPTTSPSLVRPNTSTATARRSATQRRHHPYSRSTHNSPHAATCHICPDTVHNHHIHIPTRHDPPALFILVNNPAHDSPPFDLDSPTDFHPPILPSSTTNPTAHEPETNPNPNTVGINDHLPDAQYSPSPTIDPSLPFNYPILPIPTTFKFTHSPWQDLDAYAS